MCPRKIQVEYRNLKQMMISDRECNNVFNKIYKIKETVISSPCNWNG